jgi:hypothetical protein
VRIDRADDGDEHPDAADAPGARGADAVWSAGSAQGAAAGRDSAGQGDGGSAARVARNLEYRATVDTVNRAYAIDQGYARVREIEEKTVTPAMRRIEAEDSDRHLAGLEHCLKGKDRLAEKVAKTVNERGHTVGEAFGLVKDAIRYTLCYPDDRYADGVHADCTRLEHAGFERVERENSWTKEQYKGINSRWRVPENGQLFEVQFHTAASLEAKEITHPAYEKLRIGVPTPAEQRELEDFQKRITADVPIPPGATGIPNYP